MSLSKCIILSTRLCSKLAVDLDLVLIFGPLVSLSLAPMHGIKCLMHRQKVRFPFNKLCVFLCREPDIPAWAPLLYQLQLLDIREKPDPLTLPIADRIRIGNQKRERGNFHYQREEYSLAAKAYCVALEVLTTRGTGNHHRHGRTQWEILLIQPGKRVKTRINALCLIQASATSPTPE